MLKFIKMKQHKAYLLYYPVVSSCTGTQRNETLTNCVTTPCVDMKTIGIPPCTRTPGQPRIIQCYLLSLSF